MIRSPADGFDTTIIGGGVAGTATAIALRTLGLSVALIERSDGARRRIGETLPAEVRTPLSALGLWDEFLALKPGCVFSRLSAWGNPRLNAFDYLLNPYGNAWVVARPALDRLLAARAIELGVCLFRETEVHKFERKAGESWHLALRDDRTTRMITTDFVVIATGRASSIFRAPHEARTSYDRLIGITSRVARPPSWTADDYRPLIEAVPEGWWYSVLLPDGDVDIAMMTDADLARKAIRLSGSRETMLRTSLGHTPHTRERLCGRLDFLASPEIVSANTYSQARAGDARVAVGDAAFAIDPLSGQGSYIALDGAVRAANAIASYVDSEADALRSYVLQQHVLFDQLLAERHAYYRLENRWPDAVFWSRRHDDITKYRESKSLVADPRSGKPIDSRPRIRQ